MTDFYDAAHDGQAIEPWDCLCGTPCLARRFSEMARRIFVPAAYRGLYPEESVPHV